ncbi:MAG: DUF5682 family protein [Candidatus Melainabacteria bacterium]|nr:DUF5682 family protein [Candidatus Melainabacteria bacterium]
MSETKIFGIRHHGPGSAHSLISALEEFQPDCVLIEGPPEGNSLLPLVTESEMVPPVALLVYAQDNPRQACYYPFAEFSPEWQAMKYAVSKSISCRFIDLPQSHWLALNDAKLNKSKLEKHTAIGTITPAESHDFEQRPADRLNAQDSDIDLKIEVRPALETRSSNDSSSEELSIEEHEQDLQELLEAQELAKLAKEKAEYNEKIKRDPIGCLAEIAGFSDGERWWEQIVEQRSQKPSNLTNEDTSSSYLVFDAISEAMQVLRLELAKDEDPNTREKTAKLEISEDGSERIIYDEDELIEPMREAHMRQCLRAASKEFSRIAVVCGAWHAPALMQLPAAKEDTAILKGLPKQKVDATWIPWTHGRLSSSSGYGAGIESPGWYHHIFANRENPVLTWLVKVAQLLRAEDLDASSAQVIDTLRLVEAVSSMRELAHPSLDELNDAIITVLCSGNNIPLALIKKKLIVGETLGQVPENTPGTPLERDLSKLQSKLRMKPEATSKVLELDLRKPLDLSRSELLNRLLILNIDWAEKQYIRGKSGTFHENWDLEWYPELSIRLIEAGIWGRTIEQAAAAKAADVASKNNSLATLVDLLEKILEADLPDALKMVMDRINSEAAVAGDVIELMKSVPTLARVVRYGNVRGTDVEAVKSIIDALLTRIVIGLPSACQSLDDEAADSMQGLISEVNAALLLLSRQDHLSSYRELLTKLANNENLHGHVAGRATRLLFESRTLDDQAAARMMQWALSRAAEPLYAGKWLEGFLSGSALVLIHDSHLWQLLDSWLLSLDKEAFKELLPLLRRTFSTFTSPERRQIGERVRETQAVEGDIYTIDDEEDLNSERIRPPLNMVRFLLGLPPLTEYSMEVIPAGENQ